MGERLHPDKRPYFTIVCPTKSRTDMLKDTMKSIRDTAADFDNFEIIVVGNYEDMETQNALSSWWNDFRTMDASFILRDEGQNLSDDYYNWVFFDKAPIKPRGRVFWIIGNDVIFLTDGWDEIAKREIEEYLSNKPDRILYTFPEDISKNKPKLGYEWGWFPMITREAAKTVGFFMPKEYPSWGADTVLARLYNNPKVNRSLKLSIKLDHISYHAYNMEKDDIGLSMQNRFLQRSEGALRDMYNKVCYPEDVRRLADAIKRMESKKSV